MTKAIYPCARQGEDPFSTVTGRQATKANAMTANNPATPLPWRVVEAPGNRPAIYINGPLREGRMCDTHSRSLAKLYNLSGWQQDAAYIAHACNSYGRLVEALRELMLRCDGAEGVRADGSNIQTIAASALLQELGEL